MSDSLQQQIETLVANHHDDYLDSDLGSAKAVRGVRVQADQVTVDIRLGFPVHTHGPALAAQLRGEIEKLAGVSSVQANVRSEIIPHATQRGVDSLGAVKNIIAVASGKGGVGKSTVAANLALALAAEGAQVGVLDADIYGPSQPQMLGVKDKPTIEGEYLLPLRSHGLQFMSIGNLIDEDTPMVWRGPMVTKALEQLLRETRWEGLDYLIVDMPPGTGDTQLTLAQKVPVAGAVIVTTPQELATLDARRGLQMFRKVNVAILGIVENMSLHQCSQCGHVESIFGSGGGGRVAAEYGVPLLGSLPLDAGIRAAADAGAPSVVSDPHGQSARRFRDIALRMTATLSRSARDYARKFPKITVENT